MRFLAISCRSDSAPSEVVGAGDAEDDGERRTAVPHTRGYAVAKVTFASMPPKTNVWRCPLNNLPRSSLWRSKVSKSSGVLRKEVGR